jgi:hypothetical protein
MTTNFVCYDFVALGIWLFLNYQIGSTTTNSRDFQLKNIQLSKQKCQQKLVKHNVKHNMDGRRNISYNILLLPSFIASFIVTRNNKIELWPQANPAGRNVNKNRAG